MKNLYVVCNDFDENEECVCCICGSEQKAKEKVLSHFVGKLQ